MSRIEEELEYVTKRLLAVLPDYQHAVVLVNDKGEVVLSHNMAPVKLAVVLGNLTEKLVKEAKVTIVEVPFNEKETTTVKG